MFDDFLRGPHDSEGAILEIEKIKAEFVANYSEQKVQIHCNLCNSNFISNGHKYQHW
jgi:hypothetical protein